MMMIVMMKMKRRGGVWGVLHELGTHVDMCTEASYPIGDNYSGNSQASLKSFQSMTHHKYNMDLVEPKRASERASKQASLLLLL